MFQNYASLVCLNGGRARALALVCPGSALACHRAKGRKWLRVLRVGPVRPWSTPLGGSFQTARQHARATSPSVSPPPRARHRPQVSAHLWCTMLAVGRLCDHLPSSSNGACAARTGAASSTPRSWTSRTMRTVTGGWRARPHAGLMHFYIKTSLMHASCNLGTDSMM